MSTREWGGLREPSLPAPDPDELSESVTRAIRSGDDSQSLADTGTDTDHLSVEHNGETWHLPGGHEPGDGCEEWRPQGVCDECGTPSMIEQRCDRWLCPNCWTRAANRFSVSAAARQQAFRLTQPRNHRRQWAHAVVSPPDGEVSTKRALYDNRSQAADIGQEKGFRGCSVVAHSHRPTDLGKQLFRADVDRDDEGDPVIGFWVWLRHESDELNPETGNLIEWSPHYHLIGPTSPEMDVGTKNDDWLYNLIRFNEHDLTGATTSEDSHEEMYGTYRYLSSHIIQPEDSSRQSITWHGCLANSVFVEEATQDWQHQKPSQGLRNTLQRVITELSGPTIDTDDSDGESDESDDLGDCPCDDCDGVIIGVWDVNSYLEQADPPPDVVSKMRVARDWAAGDIEPPGGLKHPQCESDAHLAFEQLL